MALRMGSDMYGVNFQTFTTLALQIRIKQCVCWRMHRSKLQYSIVQYKYCMVCLLRKQTWTGFCELQCVTLFFWWLDDFAFHMESWAREHPGILLDCWDKIITRLSAYNRNQVYFDWPRYHILSLTIIICQTTQGADSFTACESAHFNLCKQPDTFSLIVITATIIALQLQRWRVY